MKSIDEKIAQNKICPFLGGAFCMSTECMAWERSDMSYYTPEKVLTEGEIPVTTSWDGPGQWVIHKTYETTEEKKYVVVKPATWWRQERGKYVTTQFDTPKKMVLWIWKSSLGFCTKL